MTYQHREAAVRAYTTAVLRAREAYYGVSAGTPEQRDRALAKATRKADAQRRYRARKKERK